MASPTRKLSANVPPGVFDMVRARQSELPYRSESDYIFALILHDCRFRQPRPHIYGVRVLSQRADLRDKELEQIVHDFEDGTEPSERLPIEQRMAQMVVEEIAHLPARVRKIKANSSKPSARRR